jgi:hypothetical protein
MPRIEDVSISDEDRDKLNQILQDKKSTKNVIQNAKREVYGGFCSVCAELPTKNIIYKLSGVEVLERYCDSCFTKYKNRIDSDRFDFAKER